MNRYEQRAREAKAKRLIDLFVSKGVKSDTLENLDEAGWKAAEELAKVFSSSEMTRLYVIAYMRGMERTEERWANDPVLKVVK